MKRRSASYDTQNTLHLPRPHLFERQNQVSVGGENFVQSVGERSDIETRRQRLFLRRGRRQRRMRRSQGKLFVALDKAFEAEIIGGDLTQRFQLFALLGVQKGQVGRDSNHVVLIDARSRFGYYSFFLPMPKLRYIINLVCFCFDATKRLHQRNFS